MEENIGHYEINKIHTRFEDGTKKRLEDITPLNFAPCGDKYFNYENQTEVEYYGVSKLMCLTAKNYTLAGDFFSSEFEYIELKIYRC